MKVFTIALTTFLLLVISGCGYNPARDKDCPGCDLNGANLSEVFLVEINLTEANLTGADLTEARLWGALFRDANLSGSQLWRVDANGMAVTEVVPDLAWQHIGVTYFTGVNLTGAKISGNLWKADFT